MQNKKHNLIDTYCDLQKQYVEKYGSKTVLLMEVGSFYECYAVTEQEYDFLKEVCNILSIRITRKNNKSGGDDITSGNPYMAGVTGIAFNKYMKILVNNSYTVIKYSQISPPPNPKRGVTRIFSPGTYSETDNNATQKCNIISIYIEGHDQEGGDKLYTVGISILDVSTGQSKLFEFHDSLHDKNKIGSIAETYRILYNYQPIEIIYNYDNAEELNDSIKQKLGITIDKFHNLGLVDKNLTSPSAQDITLRKYYNFSSTISPLDYLNIQRLNYALVSFISILNFTYEHEKILVKNLPKPSIIDNEENIQMSFQAIEKLDILTKGNNKSLFNILNFCVTNPGKREFKNRLLNPITCPNKLALIYDNIENLVEIYPEVENQIKYSYDLSRLHRKLGINSIKPYEFSNIDQSYKVINKVINLLKSDNKGKNITKQFSQAKIDRFNRYLDDYLKIFKPDIMRKFNDFNDVSENIFIEGINPQIDDLFVEKKNLENQLHMFRKYLCLISINKKEDVEGFFEDNRYSKYIKSNKLEVKYLFDLGDEKIINIIKLDSNEKDGYYFKTTKTRYREIKKHLLTEHWKYHIPEEYHNFITNLKFKEKTSEITISSPFIDSLSSRIISQLNLIKSSTSRKFFEKMDYYTRNYEDVMTWATNFIANIDVLMSSAKMSRKYNYVKPIIVNKSRSGIRAKNIRHPIIENINKNIFVPNDIEIGSLGSKDSMLITGLNGAGKSVYIKSVTLSLVMAQAGFYVPADSFEYSPYHKIYTRIGNNDNLFKGQSTFYCEMLELDEIIRNSDKKSFIIADELCSGSEQLSAQSILASTIIHLHKQESSFLLTTHFHKVLEIEEIRSLKRLEFYHISIDYDKEKDTIIYNRRLTKGEGPKLYGVEVCKNIILDKNFINNCFKIRNLMVNDQKKEPEIKSSKYNKDLLVKECHICKKRETYKGELHTHHINEQNLAQNNGFINHFHKNNLGNLVVLCEKHHQEVHHGNLNILGWRETDSRGKILDHNYEKGSKEEKRRLKYGESEIKIVINIKSKVNSNLKIAKQVLQDEHGFAKISINTIRKIWTNNYI